MTTSEINKTLIIPSYKETVALNLFLEELIPHLDEHCAIVIADDSPNAEFKIIEAQIENLITKYSTQIIFSRSDTKAGRGSAVKRGCILAIQKYAHVEYIAECDADGSHRFEDVLSILNSELQSDLLIGSRYLPQSRIKNWPVNRRIFSYLLNRIIPKILDIKVTDITNGLRRYSKPAINEILKHKEVNHGFTYLSEQAMVLKKFNYEIQEIPTIFINRVHGSSTVTFREILLSILGIAKLIKINHVSK